MRRFGEAIVRGQAYRPRPGAYAIIHDGRDVLLTQQLEPSPEYQLPGGGIDRGETPMRALHREVFEETGWKVAVQRRIGAFQRFCYMPEYDLWAQKICQVYLCRAILQLSEPTEPHHRAIWTSPETALRILDSAGDRHMLQIWLAGH